jgi:hypothetical protein
VGCYIQLISGGETSLVSSAIYVYGNQLPEAFGFTKGSVCLQIFRFALVMVPLHVRLCGK